MSHSIITLDVREDIRSGREPFAKIMSAVAGLKSGEDLRLIAPFEPVPLFHVLGKQGFSHTTEKAAAGDWEILFTRNIPAGESGAKTTSSQCGCGCSGKSEGSVVELDARGLEPPQPLIAILEALASLPEEGELRARTDRRPIHLYAQLEERGFIGQTEETENGSFITHIRRN